MHGDDDRQGPLGGDGEQIGAEGLDAVEVDHVRSDAVEVARERGRDLRMAIRALGERVVAGGGVHAGHWNAVDDPAALGIRRCVAVRATAEDAHVVSAHSEAAGEGGTREGRAAHEVGQEQRDDVRDDQLSTAPCGARCARILRWPSEREVNSRSS